MVEQQRRQGSPGSEPVAAIGAVDGSDRVVERAQSFDVAADGAFAGPEPGGELAQRPPPS